MVKRIRIISALVIMAIIACATALIVIVTNSSIDNVDHLGTAQATSTSITVDWQMVKKADGYKIYIKNGQGEFVLYDDVKDGTAESYEFTDLTSAKAFTIKVSAYKTYRGNYYESEECEELIIYTLPEKVVQDTASRGVGQIDFRWQVVANATGYELEYGLDEDFNDAQNQDVSDSQANEYVVGDLTPKDVYFARVRAYFVFEDEKIYGEWSDAAQVTILEKIIMSDDIDPTKPMVALSFDDGPGYYNNDSNPTAVILDVLEEYNARATFFMCGYRFEGNNNFLERELALGCELGNHTYGHRHYGRDVTASDISDCSNKIKDLCGQPPTIFRCPGGMITSTIQNECVNEGMPMAYWSVDTKDWDLQNADAIYKNCMNDVYDGCIILMHDIYPTSAEAVKLIVPELIRQGYQVVTVTELITAKNDGQPPTPGQQYVDAHRINNNT